MNRRPVADGARQRSLRVLQGPTRRQNQRVRTRGSVLQLQGRRAGYFLRTRNSPHI